MQVNVEYTPPGSTSPTTILYVGKSSQCDPTKGGWYYDVDPAQGTPTEILMCPATCTELGASSTGQVDIRVGCATIISTPQ